MPFSRLHRFRFTRKPALKPLPALVQVEQAQVPVPQQVQVPVPQQVLEQVRPLELEQVRQPALVPQPVQPVPQRVWLAWLALA